MSNLLLLPIVIPLVTAIILIFFPKHIFWQRAVSAVATSSLVVASSVLLYRVHTDGIQTLNVGNWPAPFGITLVSDSLSALLVLTASIIALACLVLFVLRHWRKTRNVLLLFVFSIFARRCERIVYDRRFI
ncbi:Na(+)/H(+) antiporter subunit D [Anoxybacillus sp. BCO1]|nr:Na(+)/H(+) antiporter subunit D [Anoxybacillus sp. BCO1]